MIGGYADMQKWVSIFGLVNSSSPPPPALIPPGGAFTPTIVIFNHVTAASGIMGRFEGNTSEVNGVINVTNKILVQSDNSGLICQVTIASPVPANFTNTNQAQIVGEPQIVPQGQQGLSGNLGSGWGNSLSAHVSTNSIDFWFEGAVPNTTYIVDFSYKYSIQSSFLENNQEIELAKLLKKRINPDAQKKLDELAVKMRKK